MKRHERNQQKRIRAAADGNTEGLGLSATLHNVHEALLTQATAAVRNCPCEEGCPACIGPRRRVDRKHLVLALLATLTRD